MLGFTINHLQPYGKHLRTFLIGKMKDHKIIGTFGDDAGIRGEWTAVPHKTQ